MLMPRLEAVVLLAGQPQRLGAEVALDVVGQAS